MDSTTIDVAVKRYASTEMVQIFSQERRIRLWRDLWIALAEGEHELGLPITAAQIAELKKYRNKINWEVAEKRETEVRHDVMAHVYAFGAQCPKAAGIIHLGATSAFVTDNSELIQMRDGLDLLGRKLAAAIDRLASFAEKWKEEATVAFTHFQAAQPTTVGKRACLWLQNFVLDLSQLEFERKELRFLGLKGATGTQDSFYKLFDRDKKKVRDLDRRVSKKMGFEHCFLVTGQTYPRKLDSRILSVLASIAESASKFANDVRLLQAIHEVAEPREDRQVGSSSMPYKQNPMRCERIAALARYVINLLGNCFQTASSQWFERTLDDSANRRLVIPQAFLFCDAVLDLVINVAGGLRVREEVIRQHLDQELPFFQTEEVLMASVRAGGDRQKLHQVIAKHSKEVVKNIREKGGANDLLARLRKDPAFSEVPPKLLIRTEASRFVGLAPEQVDEFLEKVVVPVRKRYKKDLKLTPKIRV